MKIESEMVIPFSNGSEAMDWKYRNCDQCNLYEDQSANEDEAKCIPAYHIDLGFIIGEMPLISAEKIGIAHKNDKFVMLSDCKLKE